MKAEDKMLIKICLKYGSISFLLGLIVGLLR